VEKSFLVVGLGNPGPKYASNRHNFGFMVVDELAGRAGPVSWREKFSAELSRIRLGDVTYTLLKPMTYMNLSGRSVSRAASFFGLGSEEIIVVHDELDLEMGIVRVKNGGGIAGHKGLASIKELLGNADFTRVRMGIGRPNRGSVTDYVLDDFSADERAGLADLLERGADAVHHIATLGLASAMNEFNRRS
jgi:peptidyl-tRNA hydrolase, PTH1 family